MGLPVRPLRHPGINPLRRPPRRPRPRPDLLHPSTARHPAQRAHRHRRRSQPDPGPAPGHQRTPARPCCPSAGCAPTPGSFDARWAATASREQPTGPGPNQPSTSASQSESSVHP